MRFDHRVLAKIPALAALDPGLIEALPLDGHTNTVLALKTPVGGFVLRLPKDTDAIDRSAERQTLGQVAALGLAPPPLYFADDGTMLTRMEPDRAARAAATPVDDVAAVALGALLRRLHDSPLALPWTFRAVDVVTAQFRHIDEPDLQARLALLAERLDTSVERRAPAHNDVNPGNILWQRGRPWLIDWEFAGMNDPAFDLATAKLELRLSERAFAALLRGWGRDDPAWRERIEDQATLASGVAGAWYRRQGKRLADARFDVFAAERLDRCRARLEHVSRRG